MRIAIVRGDFASPWELQNFKLLSRHHELTLFTGLRPITNLTGLNWLSITRLPSPVDLNTKRFSRLSMAITNRIFTDAHVLFGLEKMLKGFEIAHCAETYYSYTQQCIDAKEHGYVKKLISTVWENIPFNNEAISGRKEFKDRAVKNIDAFLSVTRAAKYALIKEGCDGTKITVLNPGVDIDLFNPSKKKHKKLKILVVSRLVPEKGILEIVKMFQALRKKYNNVELVIVGIGPIKPEGVTLLGNVDYNDMPKVYSSCDIFIHYPIGSRTWAEQYGMAQIEAMACGLPIVALDRGSTKEVIGQGGVVVSEEKFLTAVEKLVTDSKYRWSLGQQARRFACLRYDANIYSKKLEAIYEKVLHDKR